MFKKMLLFLLIGCESAVQAYSENFLALSAAYSGVCALNGGLILAHELGHAAAYSLMGQEPLKIVVGDEKAPSVNIRNIKMSSSLLKLWKIPGGYFQVRRGTMTAKENFLGYAAGPVVGAAVSLALMNALLPYSVEVTDCCKEDLLKQKIGCTLYMVSFVHFINNFLNLSGWYGERTDGDEMKKCLPESMQKYYTPLVYTGIGATLYATSASWMPSVKYVGAGYLSLFRRMTGLLPQ